MTLRYARAALIRYGLLAMLFGVAGGWLLIHPPSAMREPLIVRGLSALFGNGWAALGWLCVSLCALGLTVSIRLLSGDLIAASATNGGLEFNTAFRRAVHGWSDVGRIAIETRRIRGREHRWLMIEADGRKRRIAVKLLDAQPVQIDIWIDDAQQLSRNGPDIAMAAAVAAHVEASASAPARRPFGRKGILQ